MCIELTHSVISGAVALLAWPTQRQFQQSGPRSIIRAVTKCTMSEHLEWKSFHGGKYGFYVMREDKSKVILDKSLVDQNHVKSEQVLLMQAAALLTLSRGASIHLAVEC